MTMKMILLGSGGLRIGQAGEFDYSGSQAIKALKEEGIKIILVNPNIATVQTSEDLADEVYFLPVEPEFVEKVIEKEKPDGILLSFGGQTALNCGVALYKSGFLKKHDVRIYGTPVESIIATEDRDEFAKMMRAIDVKIARSAAVGTVKGALGAADRIGYPIILRSAYSLGGQGSGFAYDENELKEMAEKALSNSGQILIEESLKGWKEVEYEVVRDSADNCITVCNMENMDPLGIHTGESIVVAPSQTLDNREYHFLREISQKVIRHLKIVGECNIQFALDPESMDYRVIEVNARLSRSSALASKATGYPLAFVAAKLALGKVLPEIRNSVTRKTCACFEPALDYLVIKFPKWDFAKFSKVQTRIGSGMKSVGEVMAIGRSFEEVFQKGIRMLGSGDGFACSDMKFEDVRKELEYPSDKRIFALKQALEEGMAVDEMYEITKIDRWFLHRLKNMVEIEKALREEFSDDILVKAKKAGFSDIQIARCTGRREDETRSARKDSGIVPSIKQIDTLGAEFPAVTNYLYMTYNGDSDDVKVKDPQKTVMILGSGVYKIGSSVEFDWCAVSCALTLRKLGYRTVMVNYNPETVSTDFDICDKLYFDELSLERVLDIYDKEKCLGVVVSMGGQIPNSLAKKLHDMNVPVLGTSPESIDKAEDRHKFSSMLDRLEIDQPEWRELSDLEEAEEFAERIGYPVLIRPSYVLSGAAMNVAFTTDELNDYLRQAVDVSKEHPVVISNFIYGAKEIEMDAVAKDGEILLYAISEHVENAGVHSGDSTLLFPARKVYIETMKRIKKTTENIAKELNITGPFNVQYIAKDNEIKVIECNLRTSRSFPFVSKILKKNLIELATRAMMGDDVRKVDKSIFDIDYTGVKAPQFSFSRLAGADPVLGVEMASTGEVACIGTDHHDAFLKSLLATGFKLPKKNILVSLGSLKSKAYFLNSCKKLVSMGYDIYATTGTAEFLVKEGLDCKEIGWGENSLERVKEKIDLIINTPSIDRNEEKTRGYLLRRTAIDHSIPLLTNLKVAELFVDSLERMEGQEWEVKRWSEYN